MSFEDRVKEDAERERFNEWWQAPQVYKGHTVEEATMALCNAGYKDVTEEANKQNKRTDYAAYEDPSGVGVHYCEFDYDVVELALDYDLLKGGDTAHN